MQRRDVTLVVAAVLVASGCVALGIWQLKRLGQRRARNAVLAARWALPPLELRGAVPLDSVRQRHVTARGVYDFAREKTWPGRSFEGTPGVALITPLRLADGSGVLVDRGWVPSPDAYHVDQTRYREPDTAAIVGLGLIPPRGRGDVDTQGFLPFVIQLEGPDPERGLPRRWPPPVLDNGPHLSYAIQWFSFALIALIGTAALVRSRNDS
ncbi:MAG TPA: SURF1 family protein [Gemmatimonadales bacterium]|nr:SURF1 family protein [Gemmatimonadales bacterium]